MNPNEMDKTFNKWNQWLKDVISKEITSLSLSRHIFWEVQKIIKKNKKIQNPNSFYKFLSSAYVSLAIMGIRRQVKIDKQSISFARLLDQIAKTPNVISHDRFVALYGTVPMKSANGEIDFKKFGDKTRGHIDPTIVITDLKRLQIQASKCAKFADKRVAHFDKRALKNQPTFKDIDKCIDYLEKMLKKYTLILSASCLTSVLPTWQYDWKEIFRHPWIETKREGSD